MAPNYILIIVALITIGCFILLFYKNERSALREVIAGIILLGFAFCGAWVTWSITPNNFSGGIPFVPKMVNYYLAKALFGFGVLLSLLMARVAFKRAWQFRGQ